MYTDENLTDAVTQGIFTEESIQKFRRHISSQRATATADEENFKLLASFNDIFVVIACALLLFSISWVTYSISPVLTMVSVSMLSWGLAEFFVLKRKMALPAIVLLITFVGAVFALVQSFFGSLSELSVMLAGAASSLSAWLHWRRFKVPITVAAGAVTAVVFVIALAISLVPRLEGYTSYLIFASGLCVFCAAMCWDAADLSRVSGKTDVAFWLHLVSAPLIVHPIFTNLGILKGNDSVLITVIIVALYIVLSVISVTIDRRAFMVSSLAYVLYALTQLFKTYGFAGDSFAYVGVMIGFSLLLLSGFWHRSRSALFTIMPAFIKNKVPDIK